MIETSTTFIIPLRIIYLIINVILFCFFFNCKINCKLRRIMSKSNTYHPRTRNSGIVIDSYHNHFLKPSISCCMKRNTTFGFQTRSTSYDKKQRFFSTVNNTNTVAGKSNIQRQFGNDYREVSNNLR